nr:hypothetical protein [Candidatus Njordarchaeota archaeon]
MSKPKRHERKAKVSGVSTQEAAERFEYCLGQAYGCKRVEDKGQYVVYHGRIQLGDKNELDVIVYTTDTMFISATPFVPIDTFNDIATKIVSMAQQSTTKLAEVRPITLQRAGSILEFASSLNVDNEFQRMATVILADTSNEIVLREQMKALRIEGSPLDAGIPEKIKTLKQKGAVVYRETEILNIRELRNGIAHYGNIPDRNQAIEALKIAREVLKKA